MGYENVEELENDPSFEFIRGDVKELDTCLDVCKVCKDDFDEL